MSEFSLVPPSGMYIQRLGLSNGQGQINRLIALLRMSLATQPGTSKPVAPSLPAADRKLLVMARNLGLIGDNDDGLTEAGRAIVSGDINPGVAISDRLIERFYGYAVMLAILHQFPEGLPRQDVFQRLVESNSSWNDDRAAKRATGWFSPLGWVDGTAKRGRKQVYRLSGYGQELASRLPAEVPTLKAT